MPQERMKRPIVPELRDVPLTWMDCPNYPGSDIRKDYDGISADFAHCGLDRAHRPAPEFCDIIRACGLCPRGFAA